MTKKIATPDDLSARDKQLLDLYATGAKRKDLAAQFAISVERVDQVVRRPASVAYIGQQALATKSLLFAKAGEELLARMDWGGMKLPDLLAIWKAAMPQEVTVRIDQAQIEAAAARLAERTGIPKDRAIVDIRERLGRTG